MRTAVAVTLVVALLIGVVSFVHSETNANDASALNAMYTSLNSPKKLTTWRGNKGDPCGESWKGVACKGTRVTKIQIPGLRLTGNLGGLLNKLTSVTIFDVSNNQLKNKIPNQLPPNVQRLNLAYNKFNGALPYSISKMASLTYINVSHNQIQGKVSVRFTSLTRLTTLDFSSNKMTGNLPQSFRSLKKMTNMYLQNNQFTGTVDVLGNLPLENLNVENNKFTGKIPNQLKKINLKAKGNSFSNAPAKAARNQNMNYESEVSKDSVRKGGSNGKSGEEGKSDNTAVLVAGIAISALVLAAAIIVFVLIMRQSKSSVHVEKTSFAPLHNRGKKGRTSVETADSETPSAAPSKSPEPEVAVLKPPPDHPKSADEVDKPLNSTIPPEEVSESSMAAMSYPIAELQMATKYFSNDYCIGKGSIGCVYRADLDEEQVAAVKKINTSTLSNEEYFLRLVSVISRLRLPSITELVGYCSHQGQHFLVYEFHDNGSLHEYLHSPESRNKPLTWNSRVEIALGAAWALEYLHETCSPPVIHKNVKSANILLDKELNPFLSDCGLANLTPAPDPASGYCAPEVTQSGKYTIKSDVYALGVVMLELLTGRKPFDSSRPQSEQSLVAWATTRMHDIDALDKMVDPSLEGNYPVKYVSRYVDAVAICVQPEPEFRPPMSEVVEALVRLVERANLSKRRRKSVKTVL